MKRDLAESETPRCPMPHGLDAKSVVVALVGGEARVAQCKSSRALVMRRSGVSTPVSGSRSEEFYASLLD